MKGNKLSVYFQALIKRTGFITCLFLSAVATLTVFLCDNVGVLSSVMDKEGAFKYATLILMGVGVLSLFVSAFLTVNKKSACMSDRFVVIFGFLFVGLLILAFATEKGVFEIKLGAAIAFFVVSLIVFILRVKFYDRETDLKENAPVKVAVSTLFKTFFKRYSVVAVLLTALACVGVVYVNKDWLHAALTKDGSDFILYGIIGVALLCLAVYVVLTDFREFTVSKSMSVNFLIPTSLFAVIAYLIDADNKTFAMVSEICMAFGVVMFALLSKAYVGCVQDAKYSVEKAGKKSRGLGNKFKTYYKLFFKKKTYLICFGLATILGGLAIALDGFNLAEAVMKALGISTFRPLIYVCVGIIGLVGLFMVADIFRDKIVAIDPLLFFGDVLSLIMLVSFIVSANGFTLKCVFMSAIFIAFVLVTLLRILSIPAYAVERAEREYLIEEGIIEETEEQTTEELTEEKVEEPVEETVEVTTEEKQEQPEVEETVEEVEGIAEEVEETVEEKDDEEIETLSVAKEDTLIDENAETIEQTEEPDEITSEDVVVPEKLKVMTVRKTVSLNLSMASDEVKQRYSALRNALESYGIKERLTRSKDKYSKKGISMSKVNPEKAVYLQAFIQVRGSLIKFYVNIDPSTLNLKYYTAKDVSEKFPDQATFIKIRSERAFRRTLEIIDKLAEQQGFKKKRGFKETDYVKEFNGKKLCHLDKLGYGYAVKETVTYKDVCSIDDSFAEKIIKVEKIPKPERYIRDCITVTRIVENFKVSEVCTLEALREKGLIKVNANYVKIKPNRSLSKKLTVVANEIDPKAVEMICMAGGEVTKLVEEEQE